MNDKLEGWMNEDLKKQMNGLICSPNSLSLINGLIFICRILHVTVDGPD